jgi:chorismate mutase/prephenate dehydratase
MNNAMTDLEIMTVQRDIIQNCDEEILKILEKRVEAAHIIGEVKKRNNKPIYVPEVEKAKIEKLSAACKYPVLVETIWPIIMCYTRSIE